MKITNNETGKQYQLYPDTQLEIQRTNPFFNEWGEQSAPVDLPDSAINRNVIGDPHLLGNPTRASRRILVKIEDGDYVMQSRQAILGAQEDVAINTSFYMNEGAFYDTIPDTLLTDIFGNETVPGIDTVAQAISFCTSLLTTEDERFTIFPILIDGESDTKKYINRLEWMTSTGVIQGSFNLISTWPITPTFYNSFERSEIINEATITLAPGYYISPFIKANYLLKRIFQFFGYTLLDSFFTQNEPFTKMVFLNSTVDTIVNGKIKFSDIVPHSTCGTILNIFRKKFDCEFIPDELTKSVKIILFKDTIQSVARINLTDKLTSKPIIDYPASYKQIRLSSEDVIADSSDQVDDHKSVADLLKYYPTSLLNKATQNFFRYGFSLGTATTDTIGSSAIAYQDSETLELVEITVPDCQPIMIPSKENRIAITRLGYLYIQLLYVGPGFFLNSSIKYDNSTDVLSESSNTTEVENKKPMLAFYYDANGHGYLHGTISNYNYLGAQKLWDYSLCYFGPDGVFEKFYKQRDNLLRCSMHPVRANLLLTNQQKRTIAAHEKVIIRGQELLINSLKYKIGGLTDPEESTFFTTHLYAPFTPALPEIERLVQPPYKWRVENTYIIITEAQYNASAVKDKSYTVFYPPHPTQLGGIYYNQDVAKAVLINGNRDTEYRLYTYYLTGVLNS